MLHRASLQLNNLWTAVPKGLARRCSPAATLPAPAGIGHYAYSARGLAKVKEGVREALGLKK